MKKRQSKGKKPMHNDRKTDSLWFLQEVTRKLKNRIKEVESSLQEGQKEIAQMHEYYWENYTEMDQYGYENYDNQQALLHQVNANQEQQKLMRRFKKMVQSPFFGRVDFLYDGEDTEETFYIGIGNFAEKTGRQPLIYDWRAPVSGLFYDFDRGEASYEAPMGTLTGEILSKWQYKIRNGKMVYAFESDTKIDDEILQQELGENGDVKLKNIIRTIQKEQNAIIRNTRDKILVIQGAAGSGKTSVALHRIAYLLYHQRQNLRSSDILILSPNSVFSDYISHILPELGEEPIQEMSFDLFAYHELKDTVSDCEDKYQFLEQTMKHFCKEEKDRYEWKQSREFLGEVEGFLALLEDELMDFHDIKLKGQSITERELIDLFYFKFQDVPLLERMNAVMEYVAEEFATLWQRDLREEEMQFLQKQFDSMYVTMDLYKIYGKLMETYGQEFPLNLPLDRRILKYEDVFPMLYLKQRLTGGGARQIKHLVIDEMQDYTYLQYVILHLLFPCRMTILGDKAQTMEEKVRDVTAFLPEIFGKNVKKIVMNKSYRNTMEIARYAGKLQGEEQDESLEFLERHGKEVTEAAFDSLEELIEEVSVRIDDSQKYETRAILTMTEEEAQKIYQKLEDCRIPAGYLDRDSQSFHRGLTVTTFYLAKGLEFDQVFTIKGQKENPYKTQGEYICATRALHELYVYSIKEKAEDDSSGNL